MYPLYAQINGKKYKLNTDYRIALKCLEIADNDDIGDTERAVAIVYKLFGFIPDYSLMDLFLDKAKKFLECGNEEEPTEDAIPDMDLIYDRKYINASFMSDYHIDITKTKMHYWQYCELIEAFTDNSIMARIRQLRTLDTKDFSQKDRAKAEKAKRQVALPVRMSKEEKETSNKFWQQLEGE